MPENPAGRSFADCLTSRRGAWIALGLVLAAFVAHFDLSQLVRAVTGPQEAFALTLSQQGLGIGTQLLLAVLQYLPEQTQEVWVFTGRDSKQSISLASTKGREHQFDEHTGDLTYAYLRKILGEAELGGQLG